MGAWLLTKTIRKNKVTTTSRVVKTVRNTLKYEGTKYKFSATNKRGMDCARLVFVALG